VEEELVRVLSGVLKVWRGLAGSTIAALPESACSAG
jgi:hypothetical protein